MNFQNKTVKGTLLAFTTTSQYSTHLFPLVSSLIFVFCRTLLKLGSLLWPENIPLLVCCSYGFIGCMRIVLQEHCGNIHVLKC